MNLAKKMLLIVLYGLIILMVIFSLLAIKDKGFQGYQECVDKKCETKGQEFCSKYREINNCCLGASGVVMTIDGKLDCIFN